MALGKRQTKAMLCFEYASITDQLSCNDKLSLIKSFFPSCLRRIRSINLKNQSVMMVSSNCPLFDQLYLVPGGPAATHWGYRCPDL